MNPILKEVRRFRRHLGHSRSKHHLTLMREARRSRPRSYEELYEIFTSYWPLPIEKSSGVAMTVDLMDMLKPFSQAERNGIARSLVAIQLTQGCNGKCFFCSFGLKNGVTAKLSFTSLEKYFKRYRQLIRKDQGFLLYWNSDPFDYRDGTHDFLDVFLLAREHIRTEFVSTALPIGSEVSFVRFVESVVKLGLWRQKIQVRISLSARNVKRVETVLSFVIARLKKAGLSDQQIDKTFTTMFEVTTRHEQSIFPQGEQLIDNADPLRDGSSSGCADGVVISPESIKASVVLFSSLHHPSGDMTVRLRPGKTMLLLPFLSHRDRLVPVIEEHIPLYLRFKTRVGCGIFLEPPMARYRNKWHLFFDEVDAPAYQKYSAFLSRCSLSMRHFLVFLGAISYSKQNPGWIRLRRYLQVALREHEELRQIYTEAIKGGQELLERVDQGPDWGGLAHFVYITRVYLTMTDSLMGLVREEFHPETVCDVADRLVCVTQARFATISSGPYSFTEAVAELGIELEEKRREKKK